MKFSSPIIVCISVFAIGIATVSSVCKAYAADKRQVAITDSLFTHPLDEVVVTGSNNADRHVYRYLQPTACRCETSC